MQNQRRSHGKGARNIDAMIDLHLHSKASDGTFSVSEIFEMAQSIGLKAISITDHDTTKSCREACSIGIPSSLEFITGVEISAGSPPSYPCFGSLHILGYGIEPDNSELRGKLSELQDARKNRNPQIIERLNHIGIDISLAEINDMFQGSQIGRPHIAKAMMKKGVVGSVDEAFERYIGRGGPAYADKYRIPCDQAIDAIHHAGGVAVLAHPILIKPVHSLPIETLISDLKDMGLDGLEVYYPEQFPNFISFYADIAKQFDLLMTGGTDFHGAIKPDLQMGSGKGNFSVSYTLYEQLIHYGTLKSGTNAFLHF